MPDFLKDREDIDFTGYDLTNSNIKKHQDTFRKNANDFKKTKSQ